MESQTETTSVTHQPKWIYILGYVLLAFSLILFVVTDNLITRKDNNLTYFFLHYVIAFAYVAVLLSHGRLGIRTSWRKENIDLTLVVLNLFLVSAYALNREIPVFEESVGWLCVLIVVISATTLSFRFFNRLPKWINAIQSFLLGTAFVFFAYLAIYASSFYLIGAIGTILIGVGAHIFVPLFFTVAIICLIRHHHEGRFNHYLVGVGGLSASVVVVIFCFVWSNRINAIEKIENEFVLKTTDLPAWALIGQSVKNDWITERILKSDLVYTVSNEYSDRDFFSLGSRWTEAKKHDPLVFIGSIFRKTSLSSETKIKILQAITDQRHRAQERLWSGDNLSTAYIVSDVDIYPDLRLAYTEKYLTIRNNSTRKQWWGATEEAIYTFQLPEGSVVTSLSLWIDGIEQKSILTSKQKADSAYKTIVGRERRDPSVVHWHEGNTVSARIFPCTEKEERKFKIGITSLLPVKDGRTIYSNVSFRGPNPDGANETVRVRFLSEPKELNMPEGFKKDKKGDYLAEHTYDPDLSITFAATVVPQHQFNFDGYSYVLAPYVPQLRPASIKNVFLDITNSWTAREVEALKPLLRTHALYVFAENEFLRLTTDNWSEATSDLLKINFSLFPFYRIHDTDQALVVTKGKESFVQLADIKGTPFADKTADFFARNKRVKVFNLEGGTSTYIGSFRELRGLEFAKGNTDYLHSLLKLNQFPMADESDDKIVLHDAQLIIQKSQSDGVARGTAPDHLARLFAYNDIMRKVGANYFSKNYINEALVSEAARAYVVSPVSSLIVLESQRDYDRFGIKDTGNSLHNASKQSSGAVPEPHEWALIIMFVLLVAYASLKRFSLQR